MTCGRLTREWDQNSRPRSLNGRKGRASRSCPIRDPLSVPNTRNFRNENRHKVCRTFLRGGLVTFKTVWGSFSRVHCLPAISFSSSLNTYGWSKHRMGRVSCGNWPRKYPLDECGIAENMMLISISGYEILIAERQCTEQKHPQTAS